MQIDRAFNQETIIPFDGVKVYPVLFITLNNYLNAQFIPVSLSFLQSFVHHWFCGDIVFLIDVI